MLTNRYREGRFGSRVQVNPKSEPPRQASRSVLQVTVEGIQELKKIYTLQAHSVRTDDS